MQKKWQVTFSYEVNRLAKNTLLDTYETLFTRHQYKINSSKRIESNIEKQYYLKRSNGRLSHPYTFSSVLAFYSRYFLYLEGHYGLPRIPLHTLYTRQRLRPR